MHIMNASIITRPLALLSLVCYTTPVFLNKMLDVLCSNHVRTSITLTTEVKHDLNWFEKFLPLYNGVSLYDHKPVDYK